jgi:hypothetical protein
MVAGRGSFSEAFPLFGLDFKDYDDLFIEKLDLLLQIRANEFVNWSGKFRPAINNLPIYPRPIQDPLPIWLGVGGTPQSFARAGNSRIAFDGRQSLEGILIVLNPWWISTGNLGNKQAILLKKCKLVYIL